MEESAGQKKRRRLAEAEAEAEAADSISVLPDHILHEILAFLPTRVAVSTSLLSRRWRTVWATAPDVSFTELSRFPDFPSFVDSVLLRHGDSAIPLRSFSLVGYDDDDADAVAAAFYDTAQLHSWMIRCAANPALQRLTLRLPVGSFDAPRRFDVPSAVFHLPSLKVLRLRLPGESALIDWPAAAFLPSLETLDLAKTNLRLVASDAISNSCPALKYWRMSFQFGTPELRVNCPLLEAFEIRTGPGVMGDLSICGCNIKRLRVRQRYPKSRPAYLKLSAPALQTLEWHGPLPQYAAVDSLPDSLASSLTLQTWEELLYLDENRLLKGDLSLLRINRLILPYWETIEEFGRAIFHRYDQFSPIAWGHENLKHLELTCFFEGFGSLGVAFLLKKFSKLETLHISCINSFNSQPYFYGFFKMKGSFGPGEYWDSHNLSLKQLVQVTVHDFFGERFEYDFLKFLPGVATSLRMITISANIETAPYFPKLILDKIDPFLCLVEDSKLEAVNSLSNHQTRVYGSKDDDDSVLKSLSAVELTDSQSKESMVSMIVNSIRDLPDVIQSCPALRSNY